MNSLDIKTRLSRLLLKKDAKAAGITVPITTSITLGQAMRGGFDTELKDARQAARRAALVLVSGTIESRGFVQVWGEPVALQRAESRNYAELGAGPSQSHTKGKPRRKSPRNPYLS